MIDITIPTLADRLMERGLEPKQPRRQELKAMSRTLRNAFAGYYGDSPSVDFAGLAKSWKQARKLWTEIGGGNL